MLCRMIKNITFLLITVALYSCSLPVLFEVPENNIRDYKCESTYHVKKTYSNLESFVNDNKRAIISENRRCKCDTVYIDIKDVGGMLKSDSLVYWGLGKSCK